MHVCQISSSILVRSIERCSRQRNVGALRCLSASMVPYQRFSTGCLSGFCSSSSLKRKTKEKILGTLQEKLRSFRDMKRKFFFLSSMSYRKYLLFLLFLFETVSHFPVFTLQLTKMSLTKFGKFPVMQLSLQHEKCFFLK